MSEASRIPPYVSYTQLSTFQRCKYKYWLQYILALNPVTKPVGFMRGIMLHQAVDKFYSSHNNEEAGRAVIGDEAQKALNSGANQSQVMAVEEEALVTYDNYIKTAVPMDDFEVLIPEGNKGMEVEGRILLTLRDGSTKELLFKLDGLIQRGDSYWVFEMKFQKNLDISYLPDDLQSTLYISAWNKLQPSTAVEGVLYSVCNPKPNKKNEFIIRQYTTRSQAEQKIALRGAAAVVDEMILTDQADLFPMHVSRTCSWDCQFYSACYGVRQGASIADFVDGGSFKIDERKSKATLRRR